MSNVFKACITCKPPKRYPGCHEECEAYLAERRKYDKVKEAERAEKSFDGYIAVAHDRIEKSGSNA